MRKTYLLLLGAVAGAALTVVTTQPRLVLGSSAKAAPAHKAGKQRSHPPRGHRQGGGGSTHPKRRRRRRRKPVRD